jgi:hypothetical protein
VEKEGYGYPSEAALLWSLMPEMCWLLTLLLLGRLCLLAAGDSMVKRRRNSDVLVVAADAVSWIVQRKRRRFLWGQ